MLRGVMIVVLQQFQMVELLETVEIQPLYHMVIGLLMPLVVLVEEEEGGPGHTGLIFIQITGSLAGTVRVIPNSLIQQILLTGIRIM